MHSLLQEINFLSKTLSQVRSSKFSSSGEFHSSMRHNKNAIGEEGNGQPPHKILQSPVNGFCNAQNRVRNASKQNGILHNTLQWYRRQAEQAYIRLWRFELMWTFSCTVGAYLHDPSRSSPSIQTASINSFHLWNISLSTLFAAEIRSRQSLRWLRG